MDTSMQAGHVVRLTGEVFARSAEGDRQLTEGEAIFQGETLHTAQGGSVEIRFGDGTTLSQGESSTLTIDTYVYNPDQPEESNLLFKMAEGTFRMATGSIVEDNPAGVNMESPLATIGIRGTTTVHTISPPKTDGSPGDEAHGAEKITGGHSMLLGDQFGGIKIITSAGSIIDFAPDQPMSSIREMTQQEEDSFRSETPHTSRGEASPQSTNEQDSSDSSESESGEEGSGEENSEGEGDTDSSEEISDDVPVDITQAYIDLTPPPDPKGGQAEPDPGGSGGLGPLFIPPPPPPQPKPEPVKDDGGDNETTTTTESTTNTEFTWEGTSGDDTYTGNNNSEKIYGLGGNDTLYGEGGNDTIFGGTGSNSLHGGNDTDTVEYSTITGDGVMIDLTAGTVIDNSESGLVNDSLSGFENATGSDQADEISGDSNANRLRGLMGNDTFVATEGDDTVLGGSGTDKLDFSDFTEAVTVTMSHDNTVNGSATFGNSTYVIRSVEEYKTTNYDDVISAASDGDYAVWAKDGADTITGGAGNDTLDGENGDDVIQGGLGTNVLDGGAGINTVSYADLGEAVEADLANSCAKDKATNGTKLSDTLSNFTNVIGSDYADSIVGDTSDNVITGGKGADTLNGGDGSDIYKYTALDQGGDTVDFFVNTDKFQFSGSVFTGFSTGTLAAEDFHMPSVGSYGDSGIVSGETGAGFIIDDNWKLWYDSDVATAGGEVLIATVTFNDGPSANDFEII